MIRKTCLVALLAGVVVGSGVGCAWGDPPGDSENLPPVINGFLVDGELYLETDTVVLRASDRPAITVVTWDPNGDLLANDMISWTTTDGSIVDVQGANITTGPSVRLRPPNVVGDNSVPVTMTASVSDGVNESVSASLNVEILPPCSDDNQPPLIIDVYADPIQIDLGDSATIWVEAEDPDGDTMTYEWTPDFGYIEGTGSTVTWWSTDTCCPDYYPIEVIVSDGCDSSWDYVDVWVDV